MPQVLSTPSHEKPSGRSAGKAIGHVLIISTAFPIPLNCGKAHVLRGLCDFFVRSPEVKRLTYFHIATGSHPDAANFAGEYRHGNGPSSLEAVRNIVATLLRGHLPCLQEALTYSRKTRRELYDFLKQEKPDLIICDTIRTAQYLDSVHRPPGRYFLYLDDLFSVRYERILEVIQRFALTAVNPLGNFAKFVPKPLRFLADKPLTVKALLHYEKIAVRSREIAVVPAFERCFLISPDEVAILRERSQQQNIHTLRLLLPPAPAVASRAPFARGKYFVFLGDLKLAHNHVSILDFIQRAGARLREMLPDYQVLIAGKGANEELSAICAQHPNFKLMGFVPDLQELLGGSAGLIAPLLFGSGVKIKCIDALKLGVPIVATEFGVEGLGLTADINYFHASSTEIFVQQMLRLTDPAEYARIAAASRLWFEENYSPVVVEREYNQQLLT